MEQSRRPCRRPSAVLVLGLMASSKALDLTDNVNMYIGTSYWKNVSDNHDYGNTMLDVGLPFAHTPWSAQTRLNEDKCQSPYYYFDTTWQGMRRTHWMSGSCVIDYGSASILPAVTLNLDDALHYHALDHAKEDVRPYRYAVQLPESNMKVQSVSKNAAGIFEATAQPGTSGEDFFYLLFTASDSMYNQSSVSIPADQQNRVVVVSSPVHRWYQSVGEYAGFSGHHHFQASRAPLDFGVVNGYYTSDGGGAVQVGAREGNSSAFGPAVAYLKFDRAGGPVTVATACSFISPEKAEDNMIAELAAESLFDLDTHAAEVKAVWEEKLGQITVAPGVTDAGADSKNTEQQVRAAEEFQNNSMIFYTALWHSLLLPRAVSDADGAYLSFTDGTRTVQYTTPQDSQKSDAGLSFSTYYDDYSMWDIFRAQVPLLNLLLPSSTVRDFVASLVVKAQQGRWMPIFPAWNSYTGEMVGDHCGVWVADAVLKGIIFPLDPVVLGLTARASALGGPNDAPSTLREDRQGALYYLLKNALAVPLSDYEYRQSRGRRSLDSYLQYGYIPLGDLVLESPHPRQQVSRTLEYAFDDFVALQLLQAVRAQHPEALEGLDWPRLLRELSPQATRLRGVTEASSVEEILDAVTAQLTASSANYRNVLDSAGVGFVRGRHENGTWAESDASFDPAVYYPWLTETNVWQYTWFAPHGMADLIALYGGDDAFLSKLNTFFDEGWYNHGNEPDHHAAYLAAYAQSSGRGRGADRSAGHNSNSSSGDAVAGEDNKHGHQQRKNRDETASAAGGAWQVQERVAAIIRSQYLASEQGLPGNEDAGQMSAWLVMSALGFYQVCPGCGTGSAGNEAAAGAGGGGGEYVLSTPLFDDITIHLPARGASARSAGKLQILVHGRQDATSDVYIQSMTINGAPYDCAFVTHDMVTAGGTWEFYVGSAPNTTWGQTINCTF